MILKIVVVLSASSTTFPICLWTPQTITLIVNTQGFDEEVNTDQAKAIDAAVTLLYNYDPEVLKKFLDPRIKRFTWRRHRKGPVQEVVVLRRKKLVQVSLP
jgi:hypothetical protein